MSKTTAKKDKEVDLLPETSEMSPAKRGEEIVWITDIDDPTILNYMRKGLRKDIDSIENYAQYITRMLMNNGLVTEFSSSITPLHDGFTLTMTIRIKGVKRSILERKIRYYKDVFWDRTYSGRKYKLIERMLEMVKAGERTVNSSNTPASSGEDSEES